MYMVRFVKVSKPEDLKQNEAIELAKQLVRDAQQCQSMKCGAYQC